MRRIVLAALAALALAAASTAIVAPVAQAATFACIGAPADEPNAGLYPEQREYVVWQSWWTYDATGSPQSHVHGEACLPERETLNATVTPNLAVNVKVVLHDNPGTLTYSSMVFKGTDYETTVQKVTSSLTCPVPGVCQAWQAFSAPLSLFGDTGLQEVRFRTFVPQPAGPSGQAKEMRNNLNFQLYVTGTGKSIANVTRQPYLRGKGWYGSLSTIGYCEADLLSVPIPDGPVSGVWQPQARQVQHDASLLVTHHFASLDPDFHAVPPVVGTVLLDGSGPLNPTTLAVDTSQLSNGVHRLLQKASCHVAATGFEGTNEGVLSVPFIVANPV